MTTTDEIRVLRQMVMAKLCLEVDGEVWMRVDAFHTLTGIPEDTVREYRKNGTWPDGKITTVRGRRIFVNFPAYNEWVRTGRVAA